MSLGRHFRPSAAQEFLRIVWIQCRMGDCLCDRTNSLDLVTGQASDGAAENAGVLLRLFENLGGGRPLQAFAWNMSSFMAGQVLRIAGNLIMTRLLVPEMFGVIGLVTIMQVTLALFTDMGVRSLVVQSRRGDQPDFLNTIWTLEVIRGIGLWLLALVLAVLLAAAGRDGWLPQGSAWSAPELPWLLAVAALSAVIGGFQSTGMMSATRNLNARSIAAIELTSQVLGLITMVVVGLLSRSIWSLIVGGVVSALVTTVMSHLLFPKERNRFCWDRSSLREVVMTGRWILLSSLVFVLGANIDRFVLGAAIPAREFGLYVLALNLLLLVEAIASRMFTSIALPWLSEAARASPEQFRQRLFQLRRPTDISMLALAGFLFVAGSVIVATLYDERYQQAGSILQLLSFSLVFTRFGILNMAYVALGRAELMAAVHMIKLVAAPLCMIVGVYAFGFTGALLGVALHGVFPVGYMLWLNREPGLNDFRHELLVLALAWPAGYMAGHSLLAMIGFFAR